MSYRLLIKDSDKVLGTVTEEQLQSLVDLLEEEDEADTDYYVDKDTLEYLTAQGLDPAVVELLKAAVPEDGGVEIAWKEEA